jgi:hypothetical protein
MHSKWQIWDFFSSWKRDHLKSFNGVLALNTFDPYCLKMVKDYLLGPALDRKLHFKTASEITLGWLEDEFQALSLFGNTECFFIHAAQDLNSELIDKIAALDLPDRFILLSFENEAHAWKRIVKAATVEKLTLEAPKFWELQKLLDFVSVYLRLPLSFDAKTWMMGALENNLGTFYNSCYLIKLNYPEAREIGVKEVKELLTLERLDQFALAASFGRKKFADFYGKLVELEGDFEKMRFFFMFLQSHLVKMMDTSYLAQKPRLNQYEKDIQSTAKLWKRHDLAHELERFNRWEILSKKKDNFLWHEIRQEHLRMP